MKDATSKSGRGSTALSAMMRDVGFEDVTVEFTHEVAEGMHGAIVKGVKKRGLPAIQPAAQAGCC